MADVKVLEDTVGVEDIDSEMYRVVELSAAYSSFSMEQVVARFRNGSAQSLVTMCEGKKPRHYELTDLEMDNLTESWRKFKADLAILKAAKEAERLQQIKETQAEIEKMANSVPGLEVTTMDSTWHNYDTDEDVPYTQVRLRAVGFHRVHLTFPGRILDAVVEAVEQYTSYVKTSEHGETVNWQHWNTPEHVEKSKAFLATHRAFLAEKTKEPDYVG